MGVGAADGAPVARSRALFDVYCAQCHGPSGAGGYLGRGVRPPVIAGASVTKIVWQVRQGGREMPPLSAVVLPDAALDDLANYVHQTLAHPAGDAALLGRRPIDPFSVGVLAWGALALLACVLGVLFTERPT
ncbi:MAG: c-type cytochrome [Polyangiaceae bacterium]